MSAPHDGARGDKRKAHDDDRWSHYDGDVRDLIERARAEGAVAALLDAAADLDRFADETYAEDIFQRPTSAQYAEINALLKRERGHQLDGIAADVMSRAIKVQANRLRDRAALGGAS